ncbi:NUMOD4 domain-containing protein [Streptomyces vietnamensis]|uniref:NUMOD4 domain-containing protein n=1 Tax=Streptomyces vietnamensis TaxID=362257 RepID=UPI00378A25D1
MRPVPGYDGYYVTNTGRVWSTRSKGRHAKPYLGGRWLKDHPNANGYTLVNLAPQRIFRSVHTLVALKAVP